jgi:hypothetical protein
VHVVGALDYANRRVWHDVHTPPLRREAVVELIDRIAQREQRMPLTIMVLDNATIHPVTRKSSMRGGLVIV